MARFGSSKGVGIIMFSFVGYRLGCRSRILVIGRGSGSESELSLVHFTSYPYFLFVIYYIVFYRMHGRPFHLTVSEYTSLDYKVAV